MAISLTLNGKAVTVNSSPDTPLLWVLRDELGLVGTKFGCGKALCGACTVHLNGMAIRSCQTQIGAVAGQKVTTIEGLNNNAVQKAWVALDVPQCGYCQPGQIMSATALLASKESLRCRYRQLHVGQYLPLRYVSTHSRRDQSGSEGLRGIDTWISSKINLAAISSRLPQQSAAVWLWASIFRVGAVSQRLPTQVLHPMHGSVSRRITRLPSWWPGPKWARVLPPLCRCWSRKSWKSTSTK